MKTEKSKLIVVSHEAIATRFSKGNPSLVTVADFDEKRLSPRLAKVFARVHKAGREGVRVKTLDRDDRWSARFLLSIKALRDMPDPDAEKKPTKAKVKVTKKLSIAKAAKKSTAKNRHLAKAA